MKRNDLVSVIIPCYNQAQYLEETVQSALDQTYPNIEIIIINDGSPDNTEELALNLQAKYPEKIKIVSQKNKGASEARNNGIQEALGKYILPLDADDLIHKEMVLKCVKTLEKYNVDIVYTDTKGFGEKNYTLIWKAFSETNPLYLTTSNVTALYKKKVWEAIGGYKDNMKDGCEDWEFWVNAYKHDFLFYHHSEILFYYRHKEGRYEKTLLQETYHESKIILNHPEMYTYKSVQEAISIVTETEKSADYYFYSNQKKILNEKELLSEAITYIQSNTLQPKQILTILNKKIMLCEVSVLGHTDYIKKIQTTMEIDIFLFYSSLRYNIPSLYSCTHAWYHNQELRLAKGSIFPFLVRSTDDQYELIAYKQLTKYLETTLKEKEEEMFYFKTDREKQVTLISNRNKSIKELLGKTEKQATLIKNRDKSIKELLEKTEKQATLIKNRDNTIKNFQKLPKHKSVVIEENNKTINWCKGLMHLKQIFANYKHNIKQSLQRHKNGN